MSVRYTEHSARPLAAQPVAAFHTWTFPDGSPWTEFFRRGQDFLLRFPDLADFEVSADGRVVEGWPLPGVTQPTMEHLYLNQVLPLALSRQGKLVLHGSAVDIAGRGVAFLGESGRGKSTLAASFAIDGMRFLTDDGLLVEYDGDRCLIMPSHPSIRLWEDSEEALIRADTARAAEVSFTSKARFLAGPNVPFCDQPRPLRRVYFLGEGAAEVPIIKPMRAAEVLIGLVKNSFLLDIESTDTLAWHFDELARLAARPIYFELDYPRDYDALAAVRAAVTQHTLQAPESNAT